MSTHFAKMLKLGSCISAVFSIWQSRTVAALLVYLLLNFAMDYYRPLRNIAVEGHAFRDQNSHDNKSLALGRLEKAPDILILGSSVAMSATAVADFAFLHKPFPPLFSGLYTTYTDAEFLKHKVALPLSYFNFACPGYLISHDFDLLEFVLKKGTPKLVVLMVAPRDFIDNKITNVTLKDLDENKIESKISKYLRFYAVRADLMYLVEKLAHGYYDHPEAPLAAMISAKTIDKPLDSYDYERDVMAYIERYRPLDYKKYRQQVAYLDQLLDTCERNKVPVLLVNMPLPDANLNLLPREFYDQYVAMLEERCRRRGVTLLNLQHQSFRAEDFRDAAHLREPGALKSCGAVAFEIVRILKTKGD